MSNNLVAIGDIHGCIRSLKAMWKKLEPYQDFTHVFVGDYIDRGPDSKAVIDFLLQVKDDRNTVFLRGNHEQMLLDAWESGLTKNWMLNGGGSTLDSYGNPSDLDDLPIEHLEFYKNTKLYFETEDYFFVHAGVPPVITLEDAKSDRTFRNYFLWGREHLNAFETPWEKTVIFGHTPRSHPIRKANMIGIDTGCVYDKLGLGKLTAVCLPEMKFIQQLSLD